MSNVALKNQIIIEQAKREKQKRELSRENLLDFTRYTMPVYQTTWYHETYSRILQQFVLGNLKRLMITMPPQHGKSELSTRRLPAFLSGVNPGRTCISSYNATKSREFSGDIQRIIADPLYNKLFPNSIIPNSNYQKELGLQSVLAKRTYDHFELFNHKGNVIGDIRAVGRGGALTGNPVDYMIMDDLYKDYREGNSPIIRKAVIDWYMSVVQTRLHNESQELIVFTRWHEEDLIGHIEKESEVRTLRSLTELEDIDPRMWYKINFPAIQIAGNKSELDQREVGESLWESKHSLEKLLEYRELDIEKFESLYQGDPRPVEGLLFQKEFKTYPLLHKTAFRHIKNYTDTADTGSDYLCSICYGVGIDDMIYILDIVYSQKPQEETEIEVAAMLKRNHIRHADIESNNGGRAFARNVDRISSYVCNIEWFHQSENKESRIISNASNLQRKILFPEGWEYKWPDFYKHVTRFRRFFRANDHDDCLDALTGCYEYSGLDNNVNLLWN